MKFVMMLFALAASSISAFAGAPEQGLSFEDLRDACRNPGKYQNQSAPSNLQVACEERLTHWVPFVSKEMEMAVSRQITTSLTSDKYQVIPQVHPMEVVTEKAVCPSYKETLEVSSFTKATSCEEILAFQGGEEAFCADILKRAREANPKMVQISDTGRIVEFCAESSGEQGKDQGQGKGQGKGQEKGIR